MDTAGYGHSFNKVMNQRVTQNEGDVLTKADILRFSSKM